MRDGWDLRDDYGKTWRLTLAQPDERGAARDEDRARTVETIRAFFWRADGHARSGDIERTLLAIHEGLTFQRHVVPGSTRELAAYFDRVGSSVERELTDAARIGRLRLERIEPPATKGLPRAPESTPPPASTPAVTTWFEVIVLDEVGEPLSGVALTFQVDGRTEKKTTDGAGKARVEGAERGNCSVKMTKEGDVRDKLRARWSSPRGKPWYKPPEGEEATHTIVEVRRTQDFPAVTLWAEQTHRIVLQPRVVKANLKGMWFATSKCFLLPTARHSMQCIKTLYDANPETDMLIVGHTDRAGTPAYNDPLSVERAESMAAYLTNDVDAWMAWYGKGKPHEKRWGAEEDEAMIGALADENGDAIPEDETPISWYQRTRGMPVDGNASDAVRRKLVLEYMQLDGTTLPDGIVPLTHGCGENFPIKPTADGVAEIENRRVEIFFFDNPIRPPDRPPAVLPPPPGKNSAPGSKQYPEWMQRVKELHEFEVGAWIRLIMKYDDGSLASNVPFRIRYDDATEIEASTSEAGVLMVHVMKEQGWSITGIEDESIVMSFT